MHPDDDRRGWTQHRLQELRRRDTVVILDRNPEHGNVGYNDLTTDAAGRIYVGSLGSPVFEEGEQLPGNLLVVDLDGSTRVVAEDVLLTNGFLPGGKTLPLGFEAADGALLRRRRKLRNGHLGPKRTFATLDHGAPDGLAVSTDGAVAP